MKNSLSIKMKALTLLLLFSLNTVLGFACSMGIDMGYNSHHHRIQAAVTMDSYDHHSCHSPSLKEPQKANSSGTNDCCTNGILSFLKLDKKSTNNVTGSFRPEFMMLAKQSVDMLRLRELTRNIASAHYFLQGEHPPIADIRIAIQSFQI